MHGGNRFKTGADLFWKPNGQTQLTATVNPDFGQVESDNLVVNFDAEETYLQRQAAVLHREPGHLRLRPADRQQPADLHPARRRPADDGSGPADIAGAVKLNGSIGATNTACSRRRKAAAAGRTFDAVRVTHRLPTQTLGVLLTRVDHPFLDRTATVLGVDQQWHPNDKLTVTSNVVGDTIASAARPQRGSGATTVIQYEMNPEWSQQWLAMHFGKPPGYQ